MSVRKRNYLQIPKRLPMLRACFWLCCALLLVGAALIQTFIVLGQSQFAFQRSFIGQMKPDHSSISLALPAGAILDQSLVSRNDIIQKGDTVALLNVDLMREERDRLERTLLQKDAFKQCLTHPEGHLGAQPNNDALPKETKELLTLALQECRVLQNNFERIQQRRSRILAEFEAEATLIERQLLRLSRTATDRHKNQPTPAKQADESAAIALAFGLKSLKTATDDALHKNGLLAREAEQGRLNRLLEIQAQLEDLSRRRSAIEALMKRPRLYAPADGRVIRVRSLPTNFHAQQDTEFIETRASETLGYSADFAAPIETTAMIAPGTLVSLQIRGIQRLRLNLKGVTLPPKQIAGDQVLVPVTLTQESVDLLGNPESGLAPIGEGSLVEIHISRSPQNILAFLKEEFRQTFGLTNHLTQTIEG